MRKLDEFWGNIFILIRHEYCSAFLCIYVKYVYLYICMYINNSYVYTYINARVYAYACSGEEALIKRSVASKEALEVLELRARADALEKKLKDALSIKVRGEFFLFLFA